ncbi:pol polyprotein [Gossypium australe]|uniref:Pol polyprotein n=1 Tax=Gossypium australe TaxID=47621 RepID=A0A5B6WRL8_9ROSI|nr:pol polyprotein [Gossypium australe]
MIFYLTTLNLAEFLTGDESKLSKTKSYSTIVVVVDAWKHNDFVCKNYILNGLANKLYDVIGPIIEKRHYKRLWIESMVLSKCFQVDAIIDKFPPFWNDFKNYLKHKCKEMGVEDLILRLRIGEDNKFSMKNENYSLMKEVCREQLYIGNASISKVLGIRKFILKMTSRKLLALNSVLHVTDIRKNLVFESL